MGKAAYRTWLLAGLLLAMPWMSHAAGLGKLKILSALGQPLLAEVDLVSVQKGEIASLAARLAPPEAFSQANIPYSPALVGVRMSIEQRHPDGEPYIKIVSTRAVNEPFLDLLVELSWAQGRLVREYTALIDPPGYAPAAPPVAVAPPVTAEAKPVVVAPSVTGVPSVTSAAKPAALAPPPAAAPIPSKPAAPAQPVARPAAPVGAIGKTYGPVKRGETLGRIASRVKLEGVTLEQMLVSLYHANPDAFAGNMNHLKTGTILRVPEKERVVETGQSEALKEIRVEAADWNAYRARLAQAAGETPARESRSAASGRITTRAEDRTAAQLAAREVLKLSKGEPPAAGKPSGRGVRRSVPGRIRMLEEEAIAREKALAEANTRIAQLEKTIKDMQRVIEIKAQAPVVAPAPKPPPAPESDLFAQIMSEPAYLAAGGGLLALTGLGGYLFVRRRRTQADSEEPIVEKIEPEEVSEKTTAAGGRVLALLGGYLSAVRSALRRRAPAGGGEEVREKIAPELRETAPVAAAVAARSAAVAAVPPAPMPVARGTEEVDPLAEADMYLNFGRDLQAEEVLKEALAKTPDHEEAQLKLLQIYAGRKDKAAFEKIARNLHAQTGGTGNIWLKAAAMGCAFDAANALYEAGKSAPGATSIAENALAKDIDFDFGLDTAPAAQFATADLRSSPAAETDTVATLQPGEAAVAVGGQPRDEPQQTSIAAGNETAGAQLSGDAAEPMANFIEFRFDTAPAAPVFAETVDNGRGSAHDAASAPGKEDETVPPAMEPEFKAEFEPEKLPASGTRRQREREYHSDFEPEMPPASGARSEAAQPPVAPGANAVTMLEPDFKLDFSVGGAETAAAEAPAVRLDDVSLNLEEGSAAESEVRDPHWHDVQTKFDLAKAYQEMDEKDGAREILREVITEGDAGQRTQAQKLLDQLG